ncbi:MAG: rhamnulokinase [Anaerolineae bacterium]|nr:rhamnulokinase [Anaerolineae bacterium]
MSAISVLAVDLGAESGRVMAVHFDGQSLRVEDLHRFPNPNVMVNGTLYWDFLYLWREIQAGIEKGKPLNPAGIGIDTWGVDFGLLDAQGSLIGNPVYYRDSRTNGMTEKVFDIVPKSEIFSRTGIQFMPINTLYQLYSMVERRSPQLEIARTFLTAPDLFNYWLTGEKVCEFSNATTTQMLDPNSRTWAIPLMEKLGIPSTIFPQVVDPGTRLGHYQGIPVIAPACHDTGSAVAAVPARNRSFAYISSGTWSLIGLEVDSPLINNAALAANVTNEGGAFGTFRLLKNTTGLWIVQQCRKTWAEHGREYSYAELTQMAEEATPFQALIDPDDPVFLSPGDYPQAIADFCARTGQNGPEQPGDLVRAVLESLALKYRMVLDTLKELSGQPIDALHIVGGGTQNRLLNQFAANATGLPVVAGPVEATVLGNALVQLIALGEIEDIGQGRQIVSMMDELSDYHPVDTAAWRDAYQRFCGYISGRRNI